VAQPFAQLRVPGLEDEPRSGRRVINDERVERRILDQLAKAPPPGFARWNGRLVAEALGNVSDDAVWRVMRKHDLHLDRRQSWCVSTDPEFSRKASEIVGLYLNPPENAIVLGVDEKPSIQLWSGFKATSVCPTGEPFRALLMNTKGMGQRHSSRLWKSPPGWLRPVITNAGDAGSSWIS
jgi:hypothetical protein